MQESHKVATDYYPVDIASSLLGDRWSLPIVREIAFGPVGYNEILRGLPGLSRSTLSARLRHLLHIGVLAKVQSEQPKYQLTRSGEALLPTLEALGEWALRYHVGSAPAGSELSAITVSRMHRAIDSSIVPQRRVCIGVEFVRPTPARAWVQVGLTREGSWGLGSCSYDVDLVVRATDEVFDDLWHGRRTCQDALASGDVRLDGPRKLTNSYTTWFPERAVLALAEARNS